MPQNGPSWDDLTWNWAYTTGHQASDQKLQTAAKAAWSYCTLCAWTYLNDRDSARELMDHALGNACQYLIRHPDSTEEKLLARLRSSLRRKAKQMSARRDRERSSGSMADMEQLLVHQLGMEQMVYARELLSRLSPFAQGVVSLRWHGYTWRQIANEFDMDHTAVRRAYLRELDSLLQNLSRSGVSPECD